MDNCKSTIQKVDYGNGNAKKRNQQKQSQIDTYAEPSPLPHQKRLSKAIKNCGSDTAKALELINQAEDPSASCYSAAISVCRRAGKRKLALSLLDSMTNSNNTTNNKNKTNSVAVTPNLLSFKTAVSLCALDPPYWEKAMDLVTHTMPDCGLPMHPHCVSSAIGACGRAGKLSEALNLLEMVQPPHPTCTAAAAKACERCGAPDMARKLVLQKDRHQEEKPDNNLKEQQQQQPTQQQASKLRLGIPIRVDAPIGKLRGRIMGVVTDESGREAYSVVTPLAYRSGKSLNRVVIETGRTHQIRVHMANVLGCPLVGDGVYGNSNSKQEQQERGGSRPMLHATELVVPHPITGTELHLNCPPPPDFEQLALEIIGPEQDPAITGTRSVIAFFELKKNQGQ